MSAGGRGACASRGRPAVADAASRAACGGVQQVKPRKDVNLGRAPIAIGDSPMLLALPNLAEGGLSGQRPRLSPVARGSRRDPQAQAARTTCRGWSWSRSAPTASSPRTTSTTALDLVGKKRTLGLVTPRETGGVAGHDADLVRSEARKHTQPDRAARLGQVQRRPLGWFQPDGLHLTFDGADAFARLLKKPLKHLPKPHHHHGGQRSAVRALTAAISAGGRRVAS